MKSLNLLSLLLLLAFVSCSTDSVPVLNLQIDALNHQDLDAYMQTMHPEGPLYDQTRIIVQNLFQSHELHYELKDLQILEETPDVMRVSFVQTTKRISGGFFRDNRITGIHELRRDAGVWKVYHTDIQDISYLDRSEN